MKQTYVIGSPRGRRVELMRMINNLNADNTDVIIIAGNIIGRRADGIKALLDIDEFSHMSESPAVQIIISRYDSLIYRALQPSILKGFNIRDALIYLKCLFTGSLPALHAYHKLSSEDKSRVKNILEMGANAVTTWAKGHFQIEASSVNMISQLRKNGCKFVHTDLPYYTAVFVDIPVWKFRHGKCSKKFWCILEEPYPSEKFIKIINIDCGCGTHRRGACLAAIRLDDKQKYYVPMGTNVVLRGDGKRHSKRD